MSNSKRSFTVPMQKTTAAVMARANLFDGVLMWAY